MLVLFTISYIFNADYNVEDPQVSQEENNTMTMKWWDKFGFYNMNKYNLINIKIVKETILFYINLYFSIILLIFILTTI